MEDIAKLSIDQIEQFENDPQSFYDFIKPIYPIHRNKCLGFTISRLTDPSVLRVNIANKNETLLTV